MIVALHAAIGGAAGTLTRSRVAAVALGPVLHVAADHVPHEHPEHDVWEYAGGLLTLAALARRRGVCDVSTIGAAAAVAPDLEHLVPWLRLRGRKVLHRRRRARDEGLSVRMQTLIAALILAPVLAARRQRR